MHCMNPPCVKVCPVKATYKTVQGVTVINYKRCIGCRYCLVACPFEIPKYEYGSATPRVRKCNFCAERQARGEAPACTSVCPSGALTFGKRSELLEMAKSRIYTNPDRYVHRVYGETEAGGTSWLYLSDVDLELLAMKGDVPGKAFPELVAGALAAPPFVMTLWPPLLMGLYAFSRRREGGEGGPDHAASPGEDAHG